MRTQSAVCTSPCTWLSPQALAQVNVAMRGIYLCLCMHASRVRAEHFCSCHLTCCAASSPPVGWPLCSRGAPVPGPRRPHTRRPRAPHSRRRRHRCRCLGPPSASVWRSPSRPSPPGRPPASGAARFRRSSAGMHCAIGISSASTHSVRSGNLPGVVVSCVNGPPRTCVCVCGT